jgi:hypothetical protein
MPKAGDGDGIGGSVAPVTRNTSVPVPPSGKPTNEKRWLSTGSNRRPLGCSGTRNKLSHRNGMRTGKLEPLQGFGQTCPREAEVHRHPVSNVSMAVKTLAASAQHHQHRKLGTADRGELRPSQGQALKVRPELNGTGRGLNAKGEGGARKISARQPLFFINHKNTWVPRQPHRACTSEGP